ncbi:hypothetical protein [Chlorogloeopsis fritschii]|uniref:hypothetical protein n=1 Tax=Chlorogloeopsis fritschii TaxID=1124 RepID=UPI0023F075B1|nr:hypothetical protein [Chlorogloeopsis fritschii]
MIVVCDTSPICYLLLINRIDVLKILYGVVIIPQTVADELIAPESPPKKSIIAITRSPHPKTTTSKGRKRSQL